MLIVGMVWTVKSDLRRQTNGLKVANKRRQRLMSPLDYWIGGSVAERALGAANMVEIAMDCAAGISLIGRIALYVKSRAQEDAVAIVSAPSSRTLTGETFNLFLVVR